MAKVTTNSITARAMRDICKEAIPLYLRRKGATDIDMDCLERIVFLAVVEGKEMGHAIGLDMGKRAGHTAGFNQGVQSGYADGLRTGKAVGRDEKREAKKVKPVDPTDADEVGIAAARKAERAMKKIRRVVAARPALAAAQDTIPERRANMVDLLCRVKEQYGINTAKAIIFTTGLAGAMKDIPNDRLVHVIKACKLKLEETPAPTKKPKVKP